MNIESRSVLHSTIAEGVSITLRKFSVKRRAQVELQLSEYRERQKDIARQMSECFIKADVKDDEGKLIEAGDSAEVRLEKLRKQAAFRIDFESLDDAYLKPAYLKVYIDKIEGLDIDGTPATVDTFIEDGPVELADEVYAYIQTHNGLTPGENSASGQPGTSAPPEANPTPSTTAIPAESPAA